MIAGVAAGARVGRWKLVRELAAGGASGARCFEAECGDEHAALKAFPDESRAAASAEAAVLASLSHPNVARLMESGPSWLATEWLDAGTLAEAERRDAAPLLAQALGALAHAASRGVVHGDLRPANMLVDREGRLVVVDFGFAARTGEPGPSRISGTPAYLAPERLEGGPPAPPSDAFACATAFAEWLAGAPALTAAREGREADLGKLLADVPGLHADVAQALVALAAADPARRAGAAEALERVLATLPAPLPAGLAHLPADALRARAAPSSEVAEPPLVGRDAELAGIDAVIAATREGRGAVVVVSAEAGLGRTRLAAEAARRAGAAGVRALFGRCRAEPAGRGAWRDVLTALAAELATRSASEVADLVTPDARALGLACPEMLELPYVRSLPDPPFLSPDLNKFRVFSAVTSLLRNWSRREPLLVVLDDVQWGDDATLELAYYLQRNVVHGAATFGEPHAGGAMSLLLTRRTPAEGESALVESTLADARRAETTVDLTLQRLGVDDVRQLVAGMLPGPPPPRELTDLVAAESGGSPQVAVELVRSLHAEGLLHRVRGEWRFAGAHASPSGQLADMLRRRLERASPAARELLRAAAIAGPDFDPSLAADAAGLSPPDFAAADAELLAARLIAPSSGARRAFVHEQMRRLVLDDLEPAERMAWHLAIARALDARPGRAPSAELARHYLAAQDAEGALRHLARAADESRAAGNAAEALALQRARVEAIERLPREARSRRAGEGLAARQAIAEILQRTRRQEEAAAAWLDLLAACRAAADPESEARALVGLGQTCNLAGDYAAGREHLDRALALAQQLGARRTELQAHAYLVQNAYMQGRFEEGETHVAAVTEGARALADKALTAEALRQVGLFAMFRGRTDEAIPIHREALRLLTEAGDRATMASTLHNLGILHNARGEYHLAMDCYERSLAIFREMGRRIEQAKCLTNVGNVHLQQGAAGEAERCYRQAQAIYRELGDRRSEAENLSNLGEVDSKRGDHLRALERHRQALAIHRDLDNPAGIAHASYELAVTSLELGRLDEARELVREALERDRELGSPRWLAYDLAASALLHQREGRDAQALEEVREALAQARAAGDRFHAAILLEGVATLELALGRPREAAAAAGQAHLEATSLGARETEIRALLVLAAAGEPSQSSERMERALHLAQGAENPQVAWQAWHAAARLRSRRGSRDARAAIDRAVDLVAREAQRLGDASGGFLARRDVREVLEDFLAIESGQGARAEVLMSRYHLLATEEQRARARQALAASLGGAAADPDDLRRLRSFHDAITGADALTADGLLAALLARMVERAGAERGLLFLVRGRGVECRLALARGGRALAAPEREVPRQALEWVLRERRPLVAADVATDERILWRDSVADLRVKSLMAAPVLAPEGGEPLGVAYLDRRAKGAPFADEARADLEPACAELGALLAIAQRAEEREVLPAAADASTEGLPGMVGTSAVMRQLFATARVAAESSANVLVTGPSGTGKEGLARALHALSPRSRGPFVAIDCGSVPAALVESVLFGHVRGAFTGADRDRPGLFEEAHGGTLFLDEITNAPLDVQARLLRVLQEREVRRVGGRGTVPVDVRIVAATNLDLEPEVAAGRFRQDLYYRLDVIHLRLPPLAERLEDVPLLAEHFLRQIAEREGRTLELSDEALRALSAHSWPGNVRELMNCVARMAAFAADGRIGLDRVPESVREGAAPLLELRQGDGDAAARIVQSLASGQADFWTAVRGPLRERTMTRKLAQEVVAEGLRRTQGSYRATARLFNLPDDDYGRFMDFLRFNRIKLDFRPFRTRS